MTLYRIKDWAKHYEVSDSRKVDGPLSWVAVRTKQDGFGFRRMASERDRCELLSAWILMVEIAARQRREERGKLVRDGRPLNAKSLAMMTGFPEPVFSRALEFFSNPEQGWLEAENLPHVESVRTSPDGSVPSPNTGQDRTGQDNTGGFAPSSEVRTPPSVEAELLLTVVETNPNHDPVAFFFPTVGTLKEWPLRKSKVDEYRATFVGLDVDAQLRAARQWCIDNPRRQKTPSGMTKFIFGWLERRQNSARGGGDSTVIGKRSSMA
jgi:hypothetical protein